MKLWRLCDQEWPLVCALGRTLVRRPLPRVGLAVDACIAEVTYEMEMMCSLANGAQPVSSRVARYAGDLKERV